MILDWLFGPRKYTRSDTEPTWEYSEDPVLTDHDRDHLETMAIINDIQEKLDEIIILVREMEEKEKGNE